MPDSLSADAAPQGVPASAAPPPGRGILATILFIVFLDLLGFGIILPQLPFYAMRYHVSAVVVTLLFSVYSACQFLAAPLLGLVSDRFGRRPVLIFSQLGSSLGYALLGIVTLLHFPNAALAVSLIFLARIIDGISGGNISTAQAYISDITPSKDRAKAMGLMGAAFGIGFAVGPALGGLVGNDTNRAAWPAFLAALFSFAAMVSSATILPESRPLNQANEEVWLHPQRVVSIFRRSTLRQLLLISFAAMAAFTMLEGTIALYLNATFKFGQRQVGWYFGFIGFFIIVVQGALVGKLSQRFGEWSISITGALFVTLGMSLYILTGNHPMVWLLLLAGAANATGRSLQAPPISSLVSKFSDRSEQGAVFGVYHGLSSLARVVGPVVAGLLYSHVTKIAPFAAAGVITAFVACWIMLLRTTAVASTPGFPVLAATSADSAIETV